MSTWHTDFETRSRADLGEIGAFKYAQDPSTEVMCLAIKRDDGPTLVWIPPEFEVKDSLAGDTVSDPGALDLLKAMLADDGPVYAHNAQFEVTIFRYVMPRYGFAEPALTRWRCTQAMARRANIPSSLGKAAAALNLANQKDPAGERLIKTFSIPQKDTGEFIQPYQFPDKWHAFVEYCRQDVETEHELAHVLKPFDLSGWLLDTFHTDLIINDRGMPVNMIALRNADKMIDDTSVPAFAEFNALTGLNPTQNAKLRAWFADNGLPLDNLQSDTLAALDVSTLPEAPGRAIALLRKIGFAAVKKIKTMIACAGDDGFIRGSLQFYGAAATGRWSGRLHQPQNFKRPEFGGTEEMYEHVCNGASKEFLELWYGKDIFSILASSIRHFIHDPQGPMLSADYSAIEARVAAWLAGEEWQLEVFRTHGKIYEMNAERMFGVPMAQVDKSLRQKSKVSSLACQYGGAVNAMIAMGALEMGLKEEELQPLVDAWRVANPNIVKLWYASSNAAINAVNNPGEKFFAGRVSYFSANVAKAKYLFCVLPSGRRLAYRDPIVKSERRVSKKTGNEYTQQVLSCYGQLPGASGTKSQKWGQVYLSPGLLFEHQDQSTAFDLMANGVLKAEAKGYRSYSLIHDEVLAAFDGPHQSLAEFQACLEDAPPWAAGLPLGTSGEIVKYYTK